MIFNTIAPDYYSALDRAGPIGRSEALKEQDARVNKFFEKEEMKRPLIETDELGTTVVDGQQGNFLQTVQAAIRKGASQIELEPMPEGNPNSGLEIYGKDRIEQLKEMARAAGVTISSVHAHNSLVGNVSGLGREGFSEQERFRQKNEVKRALDFASELTDGAGVVFHTGEFPRAVFDRYKNKYGEFEMYEGEEKDAIHYLVDSRTGQIIKSVKEDEEVWVPIQDENYPYEKDEYGNNLLDENGNPIPRWKINPKTNEIDVKRMEFKKYIDYEKERKPEIAKLFEINPSEAKQKVVEEFFKEQQMAEIQHQLGQSRQYEDMYIEGMKRREKILNALDEYKKIYDNTPEDEKWRVAQIIRDRQDMAGLLPPDIKNPVEYLREMLSENERQMAYGREITLSGRKNARKQYDMVKRVEHIEKYAKEKSIESMAELGIYAYKQTKEKKLKKPMQLLPENMLPEMGFGSHPEELKELVLGARKRMAKELSESQGMSESEAKKTASRHIRALLDTAHLGAWWKNFKSNPNETLEKKRERFNNWYMEQVKELEEHDIITNMHIADGTGYTDAALTPGQGKLPVVEAVEYLKKKYKETGRELYLNSEAYADPETILTGVWEAFGSPIYSIQRPVPKGSLWSDVHQAYYGTTQSPYFIYGDNSPSQEWAPWSGTKME